MMIIQKTLETFLNIVKYEHVYTTDVDDMCMTLLVEKYAGKCYKSCFIMKINKVIRTSNMYISDLLDLQCSICVQFEVDAIIYQDNEVITGCKINKIEPYGRIYAESKYANIQMKQDAALSVYKEGDIIPVIVQVCRYYPNKNKISVVAHPFMPMHPDTIIYHIVKPLEADQEPHIDNILELINKEKEWALKLKSGFAKGYEFFENMIYPFKTPQKFETKQYVADAKFKRVSIKNIKNITSGMICQPVEMNMASGEFYHSSAEHSDIDVFEASAYEAYVAILNKHLTHLTMMHELHESYPDIATATKYMDVWKMYNRLKK